VTVTVRDAVTGAPARACLNLVPTDRDRLTEVSLGESQLGHLLGCTDEQGEVSGAGVPAGSYHLFAQPHDPSRYGRQWVGRQGGTGQRHRAHLLRVTPGATSTAPPFRLDPPGRISGVLTEAGAPAYGVLVALVPFVPHPKYTPDLPISNEGGRFEVTGLGPYDWPLWFWAPRLAGQWSGGTASALTARTVRVVPGQSTPLTQALRPATPVSGTIAVPEAQTYATVVAFHAVTGEVTGSADAGTAYRLPLLAGQVVKLRCDLCFREGARWYPQGTSFTGGTGVGVGRSPVTVDFGAPA
jgi:hypothetical protein